MTTDLARRVGRNIAQTRKTAGKTQAEIAENIGIDPISLSRIERGVATPGLLTLEKIADELNISITTLFDGISSNPTALANSIISQIDPLPKEDRLFLLEQVRIWAKKLSR